MTLSWHICVHHRANAITIIIWCLGLLIFLLDIHGLIWHIWKLMGHSSLVGNWRNGTREGNTIEKHH